MLLRQVPQHVPHLLHLTLGCIAQLQEPVISSASSTSRAFPLSSTRVSDVQGNGLHCIICFQSSFVCAQHRNPSAFATAGSTSSEGVVLSTSNSRFDQISPQVAAEKRRDEELSLENLNVEMLLRFE
jgi:hypothetical protein